MGQVTHAHYAGASVMAGAAVVSYLMLRSRLIRSSMGG